MLATHNALFKLLDLTISRCEYPISKTQKRNVGDTPSRPGKVIRSRPDSTALEKTFLRELRQISPSSVVFSSLVPLSKPTPTAPVIHKLPRPLKALKNDKYTTMSHSDQNAACEDVLS